MKPKLRISLIASAAILGFSAAAEDTVPTPTAPADNAREHTAYEQAGQIKGAARASDIIGLTVRNYHDEKIGKVENLILDLPTGRVVAAVISTKGEELRAVPPALLKPAKSQDELRLDTSEQMLAAAPHFKKDNWPDFRQLDYLEKVYMAYRVAPYWTTNITAQADSMTRRARDREARTRTPLNQGNNKADLDTTAQIRRAITAEKNMSLNGRNVKIITNNGQVTLRGPVGSAEEKQIIGEIAIKVATAHNVDNQLEVK